MNNEINCPKEWQVIGTDEVFSVDSRLSVSIHCVKLPNGRIVDDYYQIALPDSVVILAMTPEKKIVLLRQYRHGIRKIALLLPAGTIEKGESPLQTAKRELLEESGYSSEKWYHLGTFTHHANYGCGKINFYFASDSIKITEPYSDDLEVTEVKVMTENDVYSCIKRKDTVSLGIIAAISLSKIVDKDSNEVT